MNIALPFTHSCRKLTMLDELMGACYPIQRHNLGDVESLPSCFNRLIDVVSRLDLCLGSHIVAAHDEEFGVP